MMEIHRAISLTNPFFFFFARKLIGCSNLMLVVYNYNYISLIDFYLN